MAHDRDRFRLVVFDPIDDTEAVRDLLVAEAGIHPTDAMQWVARMPCVSTRLLDARQAQRILDGLFELGIAAEARRPDSIPTLHPVRTVHNAACLPEGFRVRGLRGEPTHWVPWDKVELVHAGFVEQEDLTKVIAAPAWISALRNAVNAAVGRPRALLGRRPRSISVPRNPVREAILVRCDPRVAFRLAETELNYSDLGERLKPTAAENFPILLNDLLEYAPAESVSPAARALAAGDTDESRTRLYASSQALADDALVRLLWNWYRRDRDAQSWQTRPD